VSTTAAGDGSRGDGSDARGRRAQQGGRGGIKPGALSLSRRRRAELSWTSAGPAAQLSMDFHVQSPGGEQDELKLHDYHVILRHYIRT